MALNLKHKMAMGDENNNGIGIANFLEGKNYFISGATGMLGKVLVEKILRATSNVGTLFLLIKANDMNHAIRRLKGEIIDSDLYKSIKDRHGKDYEAFMREKIVPVVGNMGEDNLGMDMNEAISIAKQIHVIVHSATNTSFNERYDVYLNTNTKGPAQLLEFAKKCDNLKVFLHYSTAYVNGEKEGIIKEKAFSMGECIAWETDSSSLIARVDIDNEIKLAANMKESLANNTHDIDKQLISLGMERARMHGWQSGYQFTKAMGEMVLNRHRGNIPVVIIRPSIIESTFVEPFGGWIQGYRMLDPFFISYAKKQISGIFGDPDTVIDIVPLDMVVNATLAAIAKHGSTMKPELSIYHTTSSISNPVLFRDVFEYAYDYFTNYPLLDSRGSKIIIDKIKFFKTIHAYMSNLKQEISQTQASEVETKAIAKQHFLWAKTYEPYSFQRGRFDDEHTRRLMDEMSVKEKIMFGFDVKSINWEYYIKNVHLPGIRRNVVEKPRTTSKL